MATIDAGPISRAIGDRPPFGPIERLDHDQLVKEQQETLSSPRGRYSLGARLLFTIMDTVYGKARTLEKFRVLESELRIRRPRFE
jgi:hypothetical protein